MTELLHWWRRGLAAVLLGPLWQDRDRLGRLLARDLQARYAGSALGAGWNVLRPLLQIGAYYFAFGVVLDARLGREAADSGYPVYLLSGLIPWFCFLEGVTSGSNSLVASGALIKKVRLPIEILTAKTVLAPAVTYGPFIALLWALVAGMDAPWLLPVLAAWLAAQVLFTFFLVHALAILTAVVRDIGQAFNTVIGMTLFISPVLLPVSMVPASFRPVLYINPMTPFVEGYHRMILEGALPERSDAVIALLWVAVAAAAAALLHRRARSSLVDWL